MSAAAVGWVATAVTVGMFVANVQIIRDVVAARSTAGKNIYMFVGLLFNCIWWSTYGVLVADWAILTCNAVGLIISIAGMIAFYKFAAFPSESALARDVGVGLPVFSFVLMGLLHVAVPSRAVAAVGTISVGGTLSVFASPLTEVRAIVAARNSSPLSLLILSFQLAATSLWTLYAVLIADVFVLLPNASGLLLVLVQAYVFVRYRVPNMSAGDSDEMDGDSDGPVLTSAAEQDGTVEAP
jgi:solute carrier family 50 protein (sugar transporter)